VIVGGRVGPSGSVAAGEVQVVGKAAPTKYSVYPKAVNVITGGELAVGVITTVQVAEFP